MPSTSHTLYLIRHGARFDYASPTRWHDELSPLPYIVPTDPPLSPFGEEQARNTGATLEQLIQADLTDLSLSPTAPQLSLFSSLYYRVIQTALPLVHRLNLPLNLEVGLCEFGHVYNRLTTPFPLPLLVLPRRPPHFHCHAHRPRVLLPHHHRERPRGTASKVGGSRALLRPLLSSSALILSSHPQLSKTFTTYITSA